MCAGHFTAATAFASCARLKVSQLHFLSRPLDETFSSSSSSHRLSLARKRINAKSRRKERKRALKVADLSRLNEPWASKGDACETLFCFLCYESCAFMKLAACAIANTIVCQQHFNGCCCCWQTIASSRAKSRRLRCVCSGSFCVCVCERIVGWVLNDNCLVHSRQ